MDENDIERVLGRMVRRGIVTSVDIPSRRARVKFQDDDMDSGLLYVLASPPFIPKIDGLQRTEPISGGGGDEAFAEHFHKVKITPWLPRVNDTVLTLFLPADDSDGYILGRIEEGTN